MLMLVVANVAVKSFKFRLVAVYTPNAAVEWVSFFRRLAPFLDDSKRLVLMGDWNAILDPKINKVGRGVSGSGGCESSLVHLMTRHDLVNRFRLDHPGREMWTWLDSLPSTKVGSYLDRVLVRRADIDFVSCPTFNLIAWTDHKLVRVSLRLTNWHRLESREARFLSGALSWSLFPLSWSAASGVSQLSHRLPRPWGGWSGKLRGCGY